MKIVFDLDGILCKNGSFENYTIAEPIQENIDKFNHFIEKGNEVIIHTSRLEKDSEVTLKWLTEHGVKFKSIYFNKPTADIYFDDKAVPFTPNLGAKVNRKKLVICLSGGMDSYISYWWAIKKFGYKPEDIECIYFDIGHPYAKKEKEILPTLGIPYHIMEIGLIKPEYGNVPDEKNYIIPGRNMIFASIAAGFGERVWIMGMKFENHNLMYDKNDQFFRIASMCLSQAIGAITIVESPFINLTKTDTISWALENKLPHLHETTSCYNPDHLRCGYCSLCFKRWIAMKACGIDEKGYNTNPWESEEARRLVVAYKEALAKGDYSHYQEDRIHETLDIMKDYIK